jgi:hypothetical protein
MVFLVDIAAFSKNKQVIPTIVPFRVPDKHF